MTFNEKLKQLASDSGTLPYIFGTPAEVDFINNKLHSAQSYPICIHIADIAGSFVAYPQPRERRSVMLCYADKMRFEEFTTESVEAKSEALRVVAQKFIQRLNADGYFEPVEEVNYSVRFNDESANFVMVVLDFELTEAVGHCL